MSHFTTLKTQFTDISGLIKALADVGFKQVEVYDTAQPLYGYQGDQRKQTAEVIVRRQFVGAASNDLGFKQQPDGTFQAIISAYDRSKYSEQWLNRVSQRYAYHLAKARLEEQGFTLISEEQETNGRIHLVVRRAV